METLFFIWLSTRHSPQHKVAFIHLRSTVMYSSLRLCRDLCGELALLVAFTHSFCLSVGQWNVLEARSICFGGETATLPR